MGLTKVQGCSLGGLVRLRHPRQVWSKRLTARQSIILASIRNTKSNNNKNSNNKHDYSINNHDTSCT